MLATVAAVLLIAATGTAAAAASNAVATCQVTGEGDGYGHVCGTAYFTAETGYGDEYLELCDESKDGHSAGPAGCTPGR